MGALAAAPSPAFIVEPDSAVLFVNRAGVQATGVSVGEYLLEYVVEPDAFKAYLRAWGRSGSGVPGACSLLGRNASGSANSREKYRCAGSRLHTDSGVLLCVHMVPAGSDRSPFVELNDQVQRLNEEIGRRRAAEIELLARADELERANRLKDDFVATVSHELRTPINAVLGWATLLQQAAVDQDTGRRALEAIVRNSKSQARLVDDLLDASKIASGRLSLEVQTVDLLDSVRAAIDSVTPAAEARGIRIQAVLDPDAGLVRGDSARLQQIVWNLLSNAIKFTPKRGRVQIVLEQVDSSARLTVSDTGVGISPEFLPYVFEGFRQSDASIRRAQGGLGLGLAIVRSLVELHGGTVEAMSDGAGKGASFVVMLPRSILSQGPSVPTPAQTLATHEDLIGSSVVVVDDEADALELMRTLLEHVGITVRTASTVATALDLVDALKPDAIISDIGMPVQDGYDLIKALRSRPSDISGTAAIALTAYSQSSDRARALTAGFDAHVRKPLDIEELLAVLSRLLISDRRRALNLDDARRL